MHVATDALTLGIAVGMLGLMLWRPRGLNEAWAAVGAGALMLLFRLAF